MNKTTAGLLGGIGSFIGLAEGGEVPDPISKSSSSDSTPMGSIHSQYAPDLSYTPAPQSGSSGGPLSFVGNFFKSGQSSSGLAAAAPEAAELMLAKGGKVSAMVSPGEKYLTPKEASKVAKGEASSSHVGRVVPGTPKFKGNNYANDIVPAKLEAGGIVIPNSIMQSKDPEKSAAAFVRAHLSKNKGLKRK